MIGRAVRLEQDKHGFVESWKLRANVSCVMDSGHCNKVFHFIYPAVGPGLQLYNARILCRG